jgi:hypothetical protein
VDFGLLAVGVVVGLGRGDVRERNDGQGNSGGECGEFHRDPP